jgi:hypothetical protein
MEELTTVFSWEANCAAVPGTNGVDLKSDALNRRDSKQRLAKANIIDIAPKNAVGLPDPFLPTLPPTAGSTGVIKSFILPGNKTGVVRIVPFYLAIIVII